MKVKTLGLLAALGMSFSSYTVWSLTTPSADSALRVPPTEERPSAPESPKPLAQVSEAQFVSGNTLLVEGRLGFSAREAGKDNENFVFLDITTDKKAVGTSSPLNLAIVLDRSGSMAGKRLENALAAARGMVQRLRQGDVISLVTYNGTAEVRTASVEIDERSRLRVMSELDTITAQGDTCISCGLEQASQLLNRRRGMVDQMLLLSDGEATTGVLDEAGFRRIAGSIRNMGTAISTVGVDLDYNERVMAALAQESNGRHHFVRNADELPRIFDQELAHLASTVASNAELTLTLAPGVRMLQVFDRVFHQQGDRIVVPMGAFGSGDEKTVLIKLSAPPGAVGKQAIADVRLSYQDLTLGRDGTCSGSLSQALVSDVTELGPLDPLVAGRVERSETAAALLGANQLFKAGKTEQAQQLLAEAKKKTAVARKRALQSSFSSATRGRSDLAADFERQERVLAEAESFAAAAPAAKPGAAPPPKTKASVRANQETAHELAF